MRKIYISAIVLFSLIFSIGAKAQSPCHASFYLDTATSTKFNAVLVNNSVAYLTPPDSAVYIWMWGDGTSSVGRYPTHTYSSPGTKYIYLSMEDIYKTCSDSFVKVITIDSLGGFHKRNGTYNIKVVAAKTTGINTQVSEAFVSINPSIVTNEIKLVFSNQAKDAMVQADILSFDGKNIASVSQSLNGNSMLIPAATLQSGMYFVVVKSGATTSVLKFIKQ